MLGRNFFVRRNLKTEKCQLFDHSSSNGFRFNSRDISQLGSNSLKSSHVFLEKRKINRELKSAPGAHF